MNEKDVYISELSKNIMRQLQDFVFQAQKEITDADMDGTSQNSQAKLNSLMQTQNIMEDLQKLQNIA